MTDEQKADKKAAAKAKREAKKARVGPTPSEPRAGLHMGPKPDHDTKHTIRVRTQGGFKLYIPAIEFWAPGEEEKREVTAAQLEHLKLDGRIMIDDQIDAYDLEVAGIKDRKPTGTRVKSAIRTQVPDGLPQNYPGGKMNPHVKLPKGAKTAEELVSDEKAFLDAEANKAKRGKRAS